MCQICTYSKGSDMEFRQFGKRDNEGADGIKVAAEKLKAAIDANTPDSAEKSVALEIVDEVVKWTNTVMKKS